MPKLKGPLGHPEFEHDAQDGEQVRWDFANEALGFWLLRGPKHPPKNQSDLHLEMKAHFLEYDVPLPGTPNRVVAPPNNTRCLCALLPHLVLPEHVPQLPRSHGAGDLSDHHGVVAPHCKEFKLVVVECPGGEVAEHEEEDEGSACPQDPELRTPHRHQRRRHLPLFQHAVPVPGFESLPAGRQRAFLAFLLDLFTLIIGPTHDHLLSPTLFWRDLLWGEVTGIYGLGRVGGVELLLRHHFNPTFFNILFSYRINQFLVVVSSN